MIHHAALMPSPIHFRFRHQKTDKLQGPVPRTRWWWSSPRCSSFPRGETSTRTAGAGKIIRFSWSVRRKLTHYFRQVEVEVEQPQGLLKPRRGHFLSRRALTELGMASRNRDFTCLGEITREASAGRLPCLEDKVKQWILLGERLSWNLILLILFQKQK